MNPFVILVLIATVIGLLFIGNRPETNTAPSLDVDTETEKVETTQEEARQDSPPSKTLNLSAQSLTQVPMNIFERTDLEVLNLSGNNLSGALQAEVRHLQNLRVLDLSNNNFTGVPAEVGQLSQLEVLNLSNNPLTGLPYEIGNLKSLKVLDLRGTNYSEADLAVIRKGLPDGVEIKTQ